MKPKILIASGEGFNAENELSHAWKLSGAIPEIMHINNILKKPPILRGFHAFCIPGGFAFGDHLGAGKALSSKIEFSGNKRENLFDELVSMPEKGKIIFGVCNGFQVLSKLGFFPGNGQDYGTRNFSLAPNSSGKFHDRWVTLLPNKGHFSSKGISLLRAPVRHGEGRVIFASEKERENALKSTVTPGSIVKVAPFFTYILFCNNTIVPVVQVVFEVMFELTVTVGAP